VLRLQNSYWYTVWKMEKQTRYSSGGLSRVFYLPFPFSSTLQVRLTTKNAYSKGSGIQIRVTLVEGDHSHNRKLVTYYVDLLQSSAWNAQCLNKLRTGYASPTQEMFQACCLWNRFEVSFIKTPSFSCAKLRAQIIIKHSTI